MKYIDEFRNEDLIKKVSKRINEIMLPEEISLMEVCGTHTQAFRRFGLGELLSPHLRLIAGPGCPVCVSDTDFIDKAIALAKLKDTIILSFGDMLRVPGTESSLEKQKAEGGDVRFLYSAWDSLKVAKQNPSQRVIFLAVGFETTAPTIALTVQAAKKQNLRNLFFFSALKLIPPAMEALLVDRNLGIDGFICPGHVSTIIGAEAYGFIPKEYKRGCVICGFEPLDILEGIYLLLRQIIQKKPRVENQYMRVVKKRGNLKAQRIIAQVFKITDASWRGLGKIPKSGLALGDEFSAFDVEKMIPLNIKHKTLDIKQKKCRCGEVLKGLITPDKCPLFRRVCSPENPYGPCMVSSEGTCNAYYRYK